MTFPFPIIAPYIKPDATSTLIYKGTAINAVNASSYTLNSVDCGPAHPDRWLILVIMQPQGSTITAVTVDGNAVDTVITYNSILIRKINVPTGQFPSIGITYSASAPNATVSVYTWVGRPVYGRTHFNAATGSTLAVSSIQVEAGIEHLIVGYVGGAVTFTTWSYTGTDALTDDVLYDGSTSNIDVAYTWRISRFEASVTESGKTHTQEGGGSAVRNTHMTSWGESNFTPYDPVYVDTTGDATSQTTYTFSSRSIGTANANRRVVVCVFWQYGVARTLSGGTIGGVTATVDTQSGEGIGILSADVPTGTTGDIVVTFSGAVNNCGIAVYDTRPQAFRGNLDAGTITSGSNVTSLTVTDIAVRNKGFLIVCGRHLTNEAASASYNGTDSLGSPDVSSTIGTMYFYAWSCLTTEDTGNNDPGWSSATATPKRVAAASWV